MRTDDTQGEIARRVAAVNAVYVRTPELDDAMQLLDDVRLERRGDGRAGFGLVTGESGSGKTLLFERYRRKQPEPAGEKRPVVMLSVPTPFTPVSFMNAFLAALGEPVLPKQDFHATVPRVQQAMRRHGVELALLQEVSHIVDQKERTAKVPYYATDIIKNCLLDSDYPVPLVLSGIPVARRLVDINPQLQTRLQRAVELRCFEMSDPMSRERFELVLELFDDAAGFPEQLLANDDALVRRIHAATGGIFGRVARLVGEAVRVGVRRGARGLDAALLAEAHARSSVPGPEWRNPFLGDAAPLPPPDGSRTTLLHKRRKSP